jgi:DNA polymerase-1
MDGVDLAVLSAHIAAMPATAKTAAKAKTASPKPADTSARVNPAARPLKKGDHLFLVDGSGYIFRAYHALPPLTRKSDGLQVNAVLGFCNMLWKLLAEMKPDDRPTHLAVIFDKSEKTFRTDFYPDYKAHRPDAPDDLIPQFPLIREAVHAFEIPCLEQQGYEADDLIATYARLACEAKATTTIVSSDKDLMQLVGNGVVMYDTMKDKRIGRDEVIEKFGVPPEKVIEVQALIGDSTDNVPGVPGIGVKTAAQLIGEYGDLETLLARATEIKQEKRRQSLIENAELARISKRLVTLDKNVPLHVPADELAVHEPDYKRLIAFLKAMEFTTITRRICEKTGIDVGSIEADAKLTSAVAKATPQTAPRAAVGQGSLFPEAPRDFAGPEARETFTPISLAEKRVAALRSATLDATRYGTISTLA